MEAPHPWAAETHCSADCNLTCRRIDRTRCQRVQVIVKTFSHRLPILGRACVAGGCLGKVGNEAHNAARRGTLVRPPSDMDLGSERRWEAEGIHVWQVALSGSRPHSRRRWASNEARSIHCIRIQIRSSQQRCSNEGGSGLGGRVQPHSAVSRTVGRGLRLPTRTCRSPAESSSAGTDCHWEGTGFQVVYQSSSCGNDA